MRSGSSRLFGLFGQPISHSLSPAMHNAAFQALGLDARYMAFDVAPQDLETALAGARAMGVGGLNITVPHKERALALAREADPLAAATGAANTLVPAPEGWKAYNTDVQGFLKAIEAELQFEPRGRRCLILGAGGAARAAAVALLQQDAQEILVTNRNKRRAFNLVVCLAGTSRKGHLEVVDMEVAPERLGPGDLLVSATPLGLRTDGSWPWDLARFVSGIAAYDMAYRTDGETSLTRQAMAGGFRAASGRSMLLYQGAMAFSLWTAKPAPLEVMERALRDARPAE